MKVVLTRHAKQRCRELGILYKDAEKFARIGREATPEELALIFYAKRRPKEKGEASDHHIIYLKYCFVVKDQGKERIVITIYNPEYLFRTPNTQPPKLAKLELLQEEITKEKKLPTYAATEYFAQRLLKLYKAGKKIFYHGRPCEVIDGDIYWEPGIYIKMPCNSGLPGKFSEKFITQCSLLPFEVKDDDSRDSEVCTEDCHSK